MIPPFYETDGTQAVVYDLLGKGVIESLLTTIPLATHCLADTPLFGKQWTLQQVVEKDAEP